MQLSTTIWKYADLKIGNICLIYFLKLYTHTIMYIML